MGAFGTEKEEGQLSDAAPDTEASLDRFLSWAAANGESCFEAGMDLMEHDAVITKHYLHGALMCYLIVATRNRCGWHGR